MLWELRYDVTAYDAAYIALAGTLLAFNAARAAAPGHGADVELLAP